MIRIKFLMSVLAGTVVFVFLSGIFGQNGITSYKQLELQKREISRQTTVIQNINNELELEKAALSNDRDLIAAYARKLDYVADGEKLVKINGLKPVQNTLYDTGFIMRRKNVSYLPDDTCKIAGISVFFLSFMMAILGSISKGEFTVQKRKKDLVKGIPVYDLPQV